MSTYHMRSVHTHAVIYKSGDLDDFQRVLYTSEICKEKIGLSVFILKQPHSCLVISEFNIHSSTSAFFFLNSKYKTKEVLSSTANQI